MSARAVSLALTGSVVVSWLLGGLPGQGSGPLFAGPTLALAQPPADHQVKLAASDTARVDEKRSLSLTIAPLPGFVIAEEGPLMIALQTPDAKQLSFPRSRYYRRDAADARADAPRFDLHYRARAAGSHELIVEARFWVCNPRSCRPVKSRHTVRIDAQ